VHNQTVIPFPNENGIDISVGEQSNIAISRTFLRHLPSPYSDNIEKLNEETSNRNSLLKIIYDDYPFGFSYTQTYCLKVCFQEYIIGIIEYFKV
jgi:hypothetical protein